MDPLDVFFPKSCLECKKEGAYICDSCFSNVVISNLQCSMCNLFSDGSTHDRCKSEFGLDGHLSLWKYSGVLRKAIIKLKYHFETGIAEELIEHIKEALPNRHFPFPQFDFLLPVPLHWYRQNFRGFNQSEVLGKPLASFLKAKIQVDLLVRRRLGTPQVMLDAKKRKENVSGAFLINPSRRVKKANYLVFDDVYTTGATLKECCRILKEHGANKVWGFTLARD